jgi:hypothetical protein
LELLVEREFKVKQVFRVLLDLPRDHKEILVSKELRVYLVLLVGLEFRVLRELREFLEHQEELEYKAQQVLRV